MDPKSPVAGLDHAEGPPGESVHVQTFQDAGIVVSWNTHMFI
jgi:hypothetical protein